MNINNNTMRDSITHHDHPNMNRTFINFTYAPIWKRFVAFFLDMVLITMLVAIGYFIIQMLMFFVGNLRWSDFVSRNWYYFILGLLVTITWAYFTLCPSTSLFSTLGQLLCGLKQIDKTGNRMTFARANGKFFAATFSKIFYIGYFLTYFNDYRQTFHEMLTGTFLVER